MEDPTPFQVTLERRQHRQLKWLAEKRGRSMGSLVRESVEAYLAALPAEDDPAYGIIGLIDDHSPKPYGSVAIHHDDYIAEALESEWLSEEEIARRREEVLRQRRSRQP
jgi:hypothetical protein